MSKPASNSGKKRPCAPDNDVPVIVPTLQAIREGHLAPASITADVRQQCIDELLFEGRKVSEIAALFKKSERTIFRDIKVIRKKNAVAISHLKSQELLGNFIRSMESCYGRAARAAGQKDARPADKIEAARVMGQLAEKLVSQLHKVVGFDLMDPDDGGTQVIITFDEGPIPQPGDPDPGDPDPPSLPEKR